MRPFAIKKLLAAALFLALCANALGAHISAEISEESLVPVGNDAIFLRCEDGLYNDCNPTMWYYLEQGSSCSVSKNDYNNSITDPNPGDGVGMFVNIECEGEGFNHLCLWVEEGDNLPPETDTNKSKQLMIDCTAPQCSIVNPTAIDPFYGSSSGSTSVEFIITEQNLKSYELTVSKPGETLCDINGSPPSGGNFSEWCSWSGASDGNYEVRVTMTDDVNKGGSCTEGGAVVISDNSEPQFKNFTLQLFGLNPPIEDAFNLNELVYDEEDDELDFELLVNDCERIVDGNKIIESISFDPQENVDIGRVNINPPSGVTCYVQLKATESSTPERYSTTGDFDVNIQYTGNIEARIRHGSSGEFVDADDINSALVIPSLKGHDESLEIELTNNLSPKWLTKPADIYFIIDASGSFRKEVKSLRDSLKIIETNIDARYQYAECYNESPGCLRFGITAFGGEWNDGGGQIPNMTDVGGKWVSQATTDLTNYDEVVQTIDNLVVETGGWPEPWFDYIYNTIGFNGINWRTGATKTIVVIQDVPSNRDIQLEWNNGNCPILGCPPASKFMDPFPQGLYDVVDIAEDNNIIVNFFYQDDPDECERSVIYNGVPTCPGAVQAEAICSQNGGRCVPYSDPNIFAEELGDLLLDTLTDRMDVNVSYGFSEGFDLGWFKGGDENVFLDRGQTTYLEWLFYVPDVNQPGYDANITQKLFGYKWKPDKFIEPPQSSPTGLSAGRGKTSGFEDFAFFEPTGGPGNGTLFFDEGDGNLNPPQFFLSDHFFFRIIFGQPTTNAEISITGSLVEGSPVVFSGLNSTCENLEQPSFNWVFDDGNATNLEIFQRVYPDNADHWVRLTIDCVNSEPPQDQVQVNFTIANANPAPSIESSGIYTTLGASVNFIGTPNDPAGQTDAPFGYAWDFGDGSIGSGQQTSHFWNNLGAYDVKLTVTDKDGGIGTRFITIFVTTLLDVFDFSLDVAKTDGECFAPDEARERIFYFDEEIKVCFKIKNSYDEDANATGEVSFFDAVTGEKKTTPIVFERILEAEEIFVYDENISLPDYGIAPGSYYIEGHVDVLPEEKIPSNNSARVFFTSIGFFGNILAVPETSPVLVAITAFFVLFILNGKQRFRKMKR